ncbi:MAG: cytochrome c3 family protein [Coriobacteriales bacterium]|nr:hypothetical protein [Actinomycetes bacterium]
MGRQLRQRAVLLAAVLLFCGFTTAAFAYDEPAGSPEDHVGTVSADCSPCHAPGPGGGLCDMCHPTHGMYGGAVAKGPHGLYTSATDRCGVCHSVHTAGGAKLLPASTVTASCNTCHDGTGGRGVYGAILARTGVDPKVTGGAHTVDTTSVVPGGDAATGGSATMSFSGAGGTLGCDDCHSPHDSQTVTGFPSERWRTSYPISTYAAIKTSKLLRQHPAGVTTAVPEYGSDWCLACHAGRASGGSVMNHPVDSSTTASPAFVYARVALLAGDEPTSSTVVGPLARSNRGYLMPYPRTDQQLSHAPICQQCHEDARSVGTLTEDAGDAESFSISSTDGANAADNPRFQNFPHETTNYRLLVEGTPTSASDDLCLNCHPQEQLP